MKWIEWNPSEHYRIVFHLNRKQNTTISPARRTYDPWARTVRVQLPKDMAMTNKKRGNHSYPKGNKNSNEGWWGRLRHRMIGVNSTGNAAPRINFSSICFYHIVLLRPLLLYFIHLLSEESKTIPDLCSCYKLFTCHCLAEIISGPCRRRRPPPAADSPIKTNMSVRYILNK